MPFCINSQEHRFPLKLGMNILGRRSECDIRLPNSFISRHHISLDLLSDGSVTLIDLGSSNGIYVKGEKVSSAILQAGDSFVLGTIKFVLTEFDS